MKKNIIFGCLALALIVINVVQSFQNNQNGFSLEQLVNVAFADGESGSGNYKNRLIMEQGRCDYCLYGIQNTCDCTYYGIYCYSGGNEDCDYSEYVDVNTYSCTPDGGPC